LRTRPNHDILETKAKGDTHWKKRAFASHRTFRRGRTPITKNIKVVDERGNIYEATYPRRAKGLVKHGRARFIDENTLCLARPPKKSEDIMENINERNMGNAGKRRESRSNICRLHSKAHGCNYP